MKTLLQNNNYKNETWKGISNQHGKRISASVTCSNGHIMSLSNHLINNLGEVSPSVVCPECDWHEYIILKEYKLSQRLKENDG